MNSDMIYTEWKHFYSEEYNVVSRNNGIVETKFESLENTEHRNSFGHNFSFKVSDIANFSFRNNDDLSFDNKEDTRLSDFNSIIIGGDDNSLNNRKDGNRNDCHSGITDLTKKGYYHCQKINEKITDPNEADTTELKAIQNVSLVENNENNEKETATTKSANCDKKCETEERAEIDIPIKTIKTLEAVQESNEKKDNIENWENVGYQSNDNNNFVIHEVYNDLNFSPIEVNDKESKNFKKEKSKKFSRLKDVYSGNEVQEVKENSPCPDNTLLNSNDELLGTRDSINEQNDLQNIKSNISNIN